MSRAFKLLHLIFEKGPSDGDLGVNVIKLFLRRWRRGEISNSVCPPQALSDIYEWAPLRYGSCTALLSKIKQGITTAGNILAWIAPSSVTKIKNILYDWYQLFLVRRFWDFGRVHEPWPAADQLFIVRTSHEVGDHLLPVSDKLVELVPTNVLPFLWTIKQSVF